MNPIARPLSPHLRIYRWQISSVLSILHRTSGAALGISTLLLAWWLTAIASGPDAYATVHKFFGSTGGKILLFAVTWAFFITSAMVFGIWLGMRDSALNSAP